MAVQAWAPLRWLWLLERPYAGPAIGRALDAFSVLCSALGCSMGTAWDAGAARTAEAAAGG